jgi:hypothetical protein
MRFKINLHEAINYHPSLGTGARDLIDCGPHPELILEQEIPDSGPGRRSVLYIASCGHAVTGRFDSDCSGGCEGLLSDVVSFDSRGKATIIPRETVQKALTDFPATVTDILAGKRPHVLTIDEDDIEMELVPDNDVDLSYLDQEWDNEEDRKASKRERDLIERGVIEFYGVRAKVQFVMPGSQVIDTRRSSGLWGVGIGMDREADNEHLKSIFEEERQELIDELEILGVRTATEKT